MDLLKKYGIKIPKLLLPKKDFNLEKWAVIACDQYTQDNEYWNNVYSIAEKEPSTAHIILPEVYLHNIEKKENLVQTIHSTMKNYISSDIFDETKGFMYIERKTAFGRTRKGLVVAIDLDSYDWKPFTKNLIRSTEATIIDRIPPRIAIRKGAPLETPHIMLLVNDPDNVLIEKIGLKVSRNEKKYDTDLMLNGGHISGWLINSQEDFAAIDCSLKHISDNNTDADGSVFMFAVGDGNHSLATAKTVWEEEKKHCTDSENAKARFALVEIVNIFDTGLTFEPIHRVLFNITSEKFISFVKEKWDVECKSFDTFEEVDLFVSKNPSSFALMYTEEGSMRYTCICTDKKGLLVSFLQPLIDEFLENLQDYEIDYIHGSEELSRLAKQDKTLSLFLPPIEKDSFFETIKNNGPLPRKSFSMGEADEKRFYMECRKLINN